MNTYKCIVLDLDGCLISSSKKNEGDGYLIRFNNIYGKKKGLWIYKRPGFDDFIKKCFELSNVGVWSLGQPNYVNAVVEKIFPIKPSFVYTWCDCDRTIGRIFKNLNKIPYNYPILMIDDNNDSTIELSPKVKFFLIDSWHHSNKKEEKNKSLLNYKDILYSS